MKNVSARATFSGKAEKLFGTRDAARETVKHILDAREKGSASFVVHGHTVRTERTIGARKK